jgi:hypothetical protein
MQMSFSLLGRGGKFPLMNGLRAGRPSCIFPLKREWGRNRKHRKKEDEESLKRRNNCNGIF